MVAYKNRGGSGASETLASRHLPFFDRGLASATPPNRRDAGVHIDLLPPVD